MLAGMIIEVLLKSLIVNSPAARNVVTAPLRSITGAERQLHQVFYRHNLLDLAHAAHVELTGEQSEAAAILSQFIVWRGRYVLPLERGIDELLPIQHHDGLVGAPDRDVTIEPPKVFLST